MSRLIRDRYEVLEVMARGGQGAVLRARDVVHQRQVAVKVRKLSGEADRATVLEEARVLLGIRPHPGLPLLREDFVLGERYHLVMDWIEGRTLRQILDDEGTPGLPLDRTLDYLAKAAEALDHLHGHDPPVVHQDVKPSNLLVTPDGRVVLVDFGISSHRPRPGAESRGTRDYAAPEVTRDGPTPASDVFGLAATAYTLLTGGPPRAGEPAALPGPRGEPVLRELRRGLAIDPLRRPASAADLIEGVRAAAQLPPGGSPGGSTHRRSGKIRTARLALALAPTTVAALVTVLAFHPLGIFQHAAASPPSPAASASGSQQPPLQLIGSGPASCPRGYVCVWERPDYEGRGVAIFGTERDWTAFPSGDGFILDRVQSAYNNGYPDRLPNVALYPSALYGGSPVMVLNGVHLPHLDAQDHSFRSNRWF